jgi:hypothetical protein
LGEVHIAKIATGEIEEETDAEPDNGKGKVVVARLTKLDRNRV